ncbi:glycosyltransferase [Cryptosporangium arvum]|uniref:Glycosyltransferase n=1 Tax=Cryptosporangium arvum DSM 44712 TaxID=927661 RepID=A0A010ZPU1_9ACTN|nr:glycosyltransferase [Cryptosporangium arvum]EXG79227.1 glycosyltransferase [Cryptosporangium arvum DSM 44712]
MTVRYSFVSTYPPTQCGLATFTASLRAAIPADDAEHRVIRLTDEPRDDSPSEVVADLVAGDPASLRRAAGEINLTDVTIVQHEYGIYGGPDGEEVLALLDAIRVPRILVLHTVPITPTWRQQWVLQSVLDRSETVVLLTDAARDRLASQYQIPPSKLHVIPHGAHQVGPVPTGPRPGRPIILTWGLLGPGKGIEWGIDAMRELRDLDQPPLYLVAGQTHPKVLAHEGEAYRDRLEARVRRNGLKEYVHFDSRYHDTASLSRLITSAEVVLLPYDSPDQITSGVLTEAVAAFLPVVATPFPHAVELLSTGAGQVVPHRDSVAIAAALRVVLTQGAAASRMREAAARTAPTLHWPTVATRYRRLVAETLLPSSLIG